MKTNLVCLLLTTNTIVWLGQARATETNFMGSTQSTAALQQTWDMISNHWASLPPPNIELAAKQGDLAAQYYLGRTFFHGSRTALGQSEALKWIRNAAESGLADAQNDLGYMYFEGNGVEQSDKQAIKWYRKAAEQGYALAESNLGWMYSHGRGVKQDYGLAEMWMKRAAEQGSARLQYFYAKMLTDEFDKSGKWTPNFQVASEWYRKAADQGYAKAQYELAEMYNTGELGDDQRSNCIPWYLKAAAQGNADAQAEIGELPMLYPHSELLKSVNIVDTLRQSAERGNLEAQWRLAKRYQSGNGVPKDPVEAFKWMQKAAHNETPSSRVGDAIYELALMYEKGNGVPQNISEAHRLFLAAAEGYRQSDATFHVGQMYEKGDGVPQDDRKAAEFYANEYHFYVAPNDPDYAKYPNGAINYLTPTKAGIESLLRLWSQGRGFPDDRDKTIPGYRKPEDLIASWSSFITSAKAQYYVGEIYYQGKLIPKDLAKAADWFTKAADQGSPRAIDRIGEMWAAGISGAPDPKEAAKWYQRAAAKGLAEAQYNLGRCYAKGDGVPANLVRAWAWLQLAAEHGFPNAAQARDKVQSTMNADQVNAARTLANQIKATGKNESEP